MKKKFCFLIISAFLLSGILKAQEYNVSSKLSSDSIKVGDKIDFYINVNTDDPEKVKFPEFFEDTVAEGIELLSEKDVKYDKNKNKAVKLYSVSSYDKGTYLIPPQRVLIRDGSDTLEYYTDTVSYFVEDVVNVDTLNVDTVYADRSGVIVMGKGSFEKQLEQQIPDSIKNKMSPDSLSMLKDTLRKKLLQRFGSKIFRLTGLRKQTDISQIASSPLMKMFIVNHKGILGQYRIPGANDTVFVNEFDTVAARQALFTAYNIKDIKDNIYETPLTFSEIMYYIWNFIKNNWWWLSAILIIVLALLYYLFFYQKGKQVFKHKVKPSEPAHVIALRELDRIHSEKLWQKNMVKEYYTDLTDVLRRYLENRYDVHAMEKTSDEILDLIDKKDLMDKESRVKMRDILERSVFVKFAKSNPLPGENEKSLKQAREIVENTKEIRDTESELVRAEVEQEIPENKDNNSESLKS